MPGEVDSMLPNFLNVPYMGFALWNWVMLLLILVAVGYWYKVKYGPGGSVESKDGNSYYY